MEGLNAAWEIINGDMRVTIEPLKPNQKKILITKIIGETRKCLEESQIYFRGIITMGTWIPINHVESQPFGHSDQHALEEAEVLLLHYKDHDYGGICSRDKVIATIKE